MIGNFSKNLIPSSYIPPLEVSALTAKIKQDYATGVEILQRPYKEFNDKTLSARQSEDQMNFNTYVEPKSTDPDRNWQSTARRPITRNKIISIAAHLTAKILVPNVFSQNSEDEEDRDASEVMKSMIEWNIENSDYDITFLAGVIAALTNPAIIIHIEFAEVMQDIKDRNENGEMTTKQVIDEFFSGLKTHIIPCEELLINNIYEYEIQRQKCLLRRRYVNHDEIEGRYAGHKNLKFVKPGIRVFYNQEDGLFYENKDEKHPTLDEEVIYYNRREDLEVPFVNGIYMGKDDVNDNLFTHRRITLDTEGNIVLVPVYPFAKSGYELIDEKRFFYYKSAAFKLAPEQDLVDKLYRIVMDGSFMQAMPPIAGFGTGIIDSSIMYPGAFTSFEKEAKIEKIDNGARLDAGFNAIGKLELSMSESTQNEVSGGALPDPAQKAYSVATAEQNAQIQLGLFGKMIARLVVDTGYLMLDVILNHQTSGMIDEVSSNGMKMKYKTFLMPEQIKNGKKMTKKMVFTDEFMGMPMTEEQTLSESFKLKEQGGEDTEIYKINPYLFSRLKFLLSVKADQVNPKSEAFEKAWNLEALDRGINNPYIDQEKWTQEHLVEVFHRGESEKFMQKPQQGMDIQTGGGMPRSLPIGDLMKSKVGLLNNK